MVDTTVGRLITTVERLKLISPRDAETIREISRTTAGEAARCEAKIQALQSLGLTLHFKKISGPLRYQDIVTIITEDGSSSSPPAKSVCNSIW